MVAILIQEQTFEGFRIQFAQETIREGREPGFQIEESAEKFLGALFPYYFVFGRRCFGSAFFS